MKTLILPVFGIVINLYDGGGGDILSHLEKTPEINAIESLILACACAGIDVETPAFLEAIETAVDAAQNN